MQDYQAGNWDNNFVLVHDEAKMMAIVHVSQLWFALIPFVSAPAEQVRQTRQVPDQ